MAIDPKNTDRGAVAKLTAAGAGTVNTSDILNTTGSGLRLVIDVTAISGTTPTLTVTIQGKDNASGKYYTLLASAALNATGTTILKLYPGFAETANVSANDCLPEWWRVSYTVGGTSPSVTATIGACTLI